MVSVTIIAANSNSMKIEDAQTVTIGRGFLNCNDDKRVSKHHGEISVDGAQLKIKAIHTNPIFYKHANDQYKTLMQNSEICLKNCDKFCLIPLPCVEYEVRIEGQQVAGTENPTSSGFRIRPVGEINENLESGLISTSMSQIFGNKNENLPDTTHERTPSPENLRLPAADTTAHNDPERTPSPDNLRTPDEMRKRSFQGENENEEASKRLKTDNSLSSASTSVVASTSSGTLVKIKADPDSTSSTNQNPTTSSSSSSNTVKVKSELDSPTVSNNSSDLRPSCGYGIRCYRHTPDHRRDFAHPTDEDYRRPNFPDPPEGTPACPWGSACYRRNPQHFSSLSHPPWSVYTTSTTTAVTTTPMPILQQSTVQQNPTRYNQDEDSEEDRNDSESEEMDMRDGASSFDDSDEDADFMEAGEYSSDDSIIEDDEEIEVEDNNLEE